MRHLFFIVFGFSCSWINNPTEPSNSTNLELSAAAIFALIKMSQRRQKFCFLWVFVVRVFDRTNDIFSQVKKMVRPIGNEWCFCTSEKCHSCLWLAITSARTKIYWNDILVRRSQYLCKKRIWFIRSLSSIYTHRGTTMNFLQTMIVCSTCSSLESF